LRLGVDVGSDEPPSGDRNGGRGFHGETRSNATHASTTDPDARHYRKGKCKEAKLSYIGNARPVGGNVANAHGRADGRAIHEPHRDVAAGIAKQQVGLAIAVEVPLPIDQVLGNPLTAPDEDTAAPFISQTGRLLPLRQRMSLLPSPLKSWAVGSMTWVSGALVLALRPSPTEWLERRGLLPSRG
jgi:hypothetical protein